MDAGQVVTVARQTIWVIVKTSVPLLLVSMIVGLIISLFQTLTFYSGTDTYICSKTSCNYDCTYDYGKLAS